MPKQSPGRWILLFYMAVALCPAPARADQIVIGGANHTRTRVIALQQGVLHFRLADGAEQIAWISDIDRLTIESGQGFSSGSGSADFNDAEQYMANGSPDKAIIRYERAMRVSRGFWTDLIAARLLAACDRAGLIDRATLNFIRVARAKSTGSPAAARLIPACRSEKRTAAVVRAIQHLDSALAKCGNETNEALFRLSRYRILLSIGDPRTQAEELAVVKLAIPEAIRCERVYEVQLSAFARLLAKDPDLIDLAALDRAAANCPAPVLPSFLVLKGRTLLKKASTREDIVRASWPLMRVAIHMPDDHRAPQGLYYAAEAMARLGRPDKAIQLLQECLGHKRIDETTRLLATEARDRLQAEDGSSG